jgi:hypothetical protein
MVFVHDLIHLTALTGAIASSIIFLTITGHTGGGRMHLDKDILFSEAFKGSGADENMYIINFNWFG